METSLRVVLLLVGIFIIAGIAWDTWRARQSYQRPQTQFKSKRRDKTRIEKKRREDFSESFEDVILVQKPKVSQSDEATDRNLASERNSSAERVAAFSETHLNDFENDQSAEEQAVHAPIILNIMARQPGVFLGKKLLEAFLESHLYYGDMQIFHHHENTDGSGEIMFSVISSVEPGIFDLSQMDVLVTPGISLFFMPTRPNQAIAAFELMLRVAKQLAQRLDGELRDDERKILSLQGIDKYRDRVRMMGYKKVHQGA